MRARARPRAFRPWPRVAVAPSSPSGAPLTRGLSTAAAQFTSFGVGILATLGCLCSAAWVLMEPEIAAVATCVIVSTVYLIISEARRIRGHFFMREEDIISFQELRDVFPDRSPPPKSGASVYKDT